jgi:hypothetical protein
MVLASSGSGRGQGPGWEGGVAAGGSSLFACDGRVDEEKLRELLKVQVEQANLDYKRQYDFSRGTKSRLDFVKDCAAMMTLPDGGYLAVGVDGQGQPQPGAVSNRQLFDEARLRAVLSDFLGDDIVLRSQVHDIDGTTVAVIYLGPKPGYLWPVMDKDGAYRDAAGQEQFVFREGEVFTRDGTQTRRWHNSDLPTMLLRYANHIRDLEQARLAPFVDRITAQVTASNLATAPLGAISWNLPDEQFEAAVLGLIRAADMIGFKKLAFDLAADGTRLATDRDASSLEQLLDRIAAALAIVVVYAEEAYLRPAADALHRIYLAGSVIPDAAQRASIWRDIAARILAVLGQAVRQESWWALAPLVRRPVTDYDKSWLRHALTEAYRAGVLVNEDGKEFGGAFLSFARWHAERIPALHTDVRLRAASFRPGSQPEPDDPLLDSICQGDFLACVILQLQDGKFYFYPAFGEYYAHRTKPIVEVLATNAELSTALGAEDHESLARAVTDVVKSVHQPNVFRFDHHAWQSYLEPLGLWSPR